MLLQGFVGKEIVSSSRFLSVFGRSRLQNPRHASICQFTRDCHYVRLMVTVMQAGIVANAAGFIAEFWVEAVLRRPKQPRTPPSECLLWFILILRWPEMLGQSASSRLGLRTAEIPSHFRLLVLLRSSPRSSWCRSSRMKPDWSKGDGDEEYSTRCFDQCFPCVAGLQLQTTAVSSVVVFTVLLRPCGEDEM